MSQQQHNLQATPLIHEMVRDGRARPSEGAMLLQLRRDLKKQNLRRDRGLVGTIVVGVAFLVLGMFGIRRSPTA